MDPRDNTNVFVVYDQYGRKTNQLDALGRVVRTEYGVPEKRTIRITDPAGEAWLEAYDRKGHLLAQIDPLGNSTRYTYEEHGNRTSVREPLGWKTTFGYDDRANVIARTNAHGEVTRWVYHTNSLPGLPHFNKPVQHITPQPAGINGSSTWTNYYDIEDATGNLLQHRDGLGTLVSYTYYTNGLVATNIDANGKISSFVYDMNGFLSGRTDAANNTWQFEVNDVGWKLAETNPLNDRTTFAYDLNGNPVQTTDPLNRTFTRQWDANGNLMAQSDGKGQFTRHAYDAANQRVATTNRVGSVWQFAFTSRGKPDRTTAPLIGSTTNFYDSANRLVAVSDPLGNTITNQYDANGNSVALFDTLGQRWTKQFDRLNRVIAESDPLGNTKQTSHDQAGRIYQVFTPNGFPSTHEYDGRGRLTKWKDAEGFDWLYTYDGNGNITNITDALGGHYVMAYGPRNERTLERNQDGKEWQYSYDPLLRLKTQRDPNGTTRTRKYDQAGRVTSLTLSTGREDSYSYDDNDNPKVIVRRVNDVAVATTKLTPDPLDRVTRVDDPHDQSVEYGFDALSRVVSITYPGDHTLLNRYDALSRLTNQVDWAARQMSYTYDKAGRLIRRVYPNGVVQTNTFDSAGRLTGLSHSSLNPQPSTINIALTYAYDRNGNKVGNSERGTFAWPTPSPTDETSSFTAAGRITNRVDALNPANNFTYQYDASDNMTNAAGGGQSWALTYDEDNRTTSLLWTTNGNPTLVINRYDALGRRIARKVGVVETRYVLDLSGGMERILCDTTASGQVTAWYIHGPDLCYRVDASNNIICYHADAQANIISLTDSSGTNVAQYAYTPYGRSLGSTNFQSPISNPYLFVGSQGVMEELPGLYFMRARYYSADAGVFLSTDPVKKIGPGWKPVAYGYANGNPVRFNDPNGEFIPIVAVIAAIGTWYVVEQTALQPLKTLFEVSEIETGLVAETVTVEEADRFREKVLLDVGMPTSFDRLYGAVVTQAHGVDELISAATASNPSQRQKEARNAMIGVLPFGTSALIASSMIRTYQNIGTATGNLLSSNSGASSGGGRGGSMSGKAVNSYSTPATLNPKQVSPPALPSNSSDTGGGTRSRVSNSQTGNQKQTTTNQPQTTTSSSSTSIWARVKNIVTSFWNRMTGKK